MRSCSFLGTLIVFLIGAIQMTPGICSGSETTEFEALLIWGTNDPKPDDKGVKPVEKEVGEKLKKLPFKWEYYYEVNRKRCLLEQGRTQKLRLSKKCEVSVRRMDKEKIEFTLIGKGKEVGRVTQELPRGEILVTGGNAENFTSWFVVLRHPD